MTHRVQNETIGFHTKFSVRAAGHTTSRRHLGDHLQNHLTFDNTQLLTSVFKVAEVPSTWVTAASEGLDGIHKVFNAFLDTPNGKDLHDPLETILNTITESAPTDENVHTRFLWKSSENALRDENKATGLRRKSDLAFFDLEDHRRLWRHCVAHVEVQADEHEDPAYPIDPSSTPASWLTKVADVSRAHLASRPFLLFSPCLMICGGSFYASIWDRAGGVISQRYELTAQRKLFIRLVFQIARRLTPFELGRDPSVTMHNTGNDQKPSFSVDFEDWGQWTTTDLIFQSVSLFGRGTSVWGVKNAQGEERVMKIAWRNKTQEAESDIYDQIASKLAANEGWPKGVARKVTGGDVPSRTAGVQNPNTASTQLITISSIRSGIVDSLEEDIVLHRVLLKERGKPLWEYDKPSTLLLAMIDALKGHKRVHELGYLHQDISAGNVLLAINADEQGHHGFITDFDCARKHPLPQSATSQPAMSGTAQFMAFELLLALKHRRKIPHEVHHDVESFVWVFVYSILLHEHNRYSKEQQKVDYEAWKLLDEAVQFLFGSTDITKLVAGRTMIKSQLECLPDNSLGECAEDLLGKLLANDNIVRENAKAMKRAARRGRAVNSDDLVVVPVLDHDSLIVIFEASLDVALADERAPA